MTRRDWILLVLIVAIGAFCRLNQLDQKSLWSDEIATIASASGNSIDPDAFRFHGKSFDPPAPVTARTYLEKATRRHGDFAFDQTAKVLRDNVHPPLFFWLMNVVVTLFGTDAFMLRLPAVLFGVLSIPLMFLVGRRLHSSQMGMLSAALMAFSAYQISHAQDARQYTLLTCIGLVSVWIALRLVPEKKEASANHPAWWGGLSLLTAMGLYTQYFYAPFAAFVYLYLLWQGVRDKQFLVRWAVSAMVAGLLMLPWWPSFQAQMAFLKTAGHYTHGLWNPIKLPETLWRSLNEFLAPDNPVARLLAFIVLLAATVKGWWQGKKEGYRMARALRFALFWLVALIGGQMLIDIMKDSHTLTIRRYLFLASPAYYLLLGYALLQIRSPRFRWATIVASLAMLGTVLMTPVPATSSDEFRLAAAYIGEQSHHKKPLVLVNKSGAMAVGMAYYLPPETPMLGIDAPNSDALKDESPVIRRLSTHLPGYETIYMVFAHEAPSTRNRLMDWLPGQGFLLRDEHPVPGVRVYRFDRTTRP